MKSQLIQKFFGLLIGLFLMTGFASAQLTIDTAMDPTQMVQNLAGNGVIITNVQVTAAPNSFGYFTSQGTELGSGQGLLLTTGRAVNAIGPNNSSGLPQLSGPPNFTCLNCSQFDNNFPGDSLLNLAQNRNTFDACRIEFDIIPQGDSLSFEYTFASEEYLEWVGSPFNDVFGFYISGPNIGTDVNIALVPNTGQSVAINNVNNTQNQAFFFNNQNPFGQGIQYDGFTRNLVARIGNLIPCEVYHLELVIADGSDRLYDSGVFVERIESTPVVVLTSTAGGLDYMIEGCNDGIVTFSRPEAVPSSQSVVYWIGGTATNGVDYSQIGSGIPGGLNSVVIPANETSVSIDVTPFADGIAESEEYITIYLDNPQCANVQVLDSVNFFIRDFLVANIVQDTVAVCAGGCADVNIEVAQTPVSSYNWEPSAGVSDTLSTSTQICSATSEWYVVTSRVSNCIAQDSVFISVSNLDITLDIENSACSSAGVGSITPVVSGAVEPVSFNWTGPDGFTSTDATITNLTAGEYCLSIEDANGCLGEACGTVEVSESLTLEPSQISSFTCFPISCNGACDGTITVNVSGGNGNYSYLWSNGATTATVTGLCAGTYEVTVTDEAGCEVTDDFVLTEPELLAVELIGTIDVLCDGSSNGEISVDAAGGCGPYIFSWSHDPNLTTNIATGLVSGDYEVNVTDQNNCASSGALTITVNPPINPLEVTVDEVSIYPGGFNTSCPGSSDAFVNTTVSNGTEPYDIQWRNLSTNELVATGEDVTDIPCGTFRLRVIDANGCIFQTVQTISCVPQIQVNATSAPNPCGDPNAGLGSITVQNVSGGNGGPYTFSYEGPTCAPCIQEDLLNVPSGDYVLTVTDNQGCTREQSINVGSNDSFSLDGAITNVTCNDGTDGAINLTVTPSGAYVYEWEDSNGNPISTNQDVSGLPAGTYTVTVSNDLGGNEVDMIVNGSTSISVSTSGAHTFLSDLEWHLVGPPSCGSPDVTLSPNRGGGAVNCNGGNDFIGLVFTTASSDNFNVCTAGAPASGVFGSSGINPTPINWSLLNGCSVLQPGWSVQVWDCVGGDFGVLQNASITFTGTDTQGNPQTVVYDSGSIASDITVTSCSGAAAANYTVTADQIPNLGGGTPGGCTTTQTFTITEPEPIVPFVLEAINPACFGVNNGSINIEVIGGTEPYSFNWQPVGFFPGAVTEDVSSLAAGTYTVTVTDDNGCTGTLNFTLEAPQVMDITVQVSSFAGGFNISCAGANDGQITVNVSGGTPDCAAFAPYCYNYDWVGGLPGSELLPPTNPTSQILSGVQEGTFTVNVTDANGCLATTTVDLIAPPPTEADAVITDISCFGETDGAISYTITGGSGTYIDFDWSPSVAPNDPSAGTLTNLAAGCYTLTVTDNNQCTSDFEFCINEPEEIEVEVQFTEIDCATQTGSTATINATGGSGVLDIVTEGPGGPYAGSIIGPLEDGAYTTTVTDENGCSTEVSFNIVAPQAFDLTLNAVVQDPGQSFILKCRGDDNGAILATPNGGVAPFTYEWTNELGEIVGNEAQVNGLVAGTYCVEVTDAIGCSANSCFEITQPETFITTTSNVSIYPGDYNISCFGACDGSIEVNVQGGVPGYTYLWNDGDGLSTEPNQSNLCAQTYNLLITDENGCDTLLTFVLTEPAPIVINGTLSLFDGGFNISCNGVCDGTIDVEILGGEAPYTTAWSGGLTPGIGQSELCAGTYNLTVTDALGCTEEAAFEINEPEVLTASATAVYRCEEANTEICSTVSGGSGSYSYNWDNGTNGLCTIVTASGNYCLTVTDSNGCEDEVCTDAVVYPALLATFDITNTTCGSSNGAIATTVTGGSGSAIFFWTGAGVQAANEDQVNLPGGAYTVVVSDATSGCQIEEAMNVATSVAPTLATTVQGASCFGGNNGTALATVTNASFPLSFTWVDAQGNTIGDTEFIDELTAGTYTLTWLDGAGCTETEDVLVGEATAVVIEADILLYENGFNVSGFGASDGIIEIEVSGGTPQYSFDWAHIDGTGNPGDLTNLSAGDYTITVIDAAGCSVDSTFTITEPSELELLNGLTPNNDGFNDAYLIRGLAPNKGAELKVFNRWGNLVYEQSNYYDQWRGQNSDGDELATGTYFVVFKLGNRELSTYVDLRR